MLVNAEAGFIQGRRSDGSFVESFREDLFSDELTEGNARQWTVFVPHDVPGLAERLGGRERTLRYLEDLFENAAAAEKTVLPDLWYWHGNEPDIHAAYMFAELGRPDLTQKWVHWILEHRYASTPAGLDGNDDGGTLSAWYVFSALGFYPKVAEKRYVLGKPLFPKATIHLGGGRDFTIVASGLSEGAIYVASARLNGRPLKTPFILHDDVVAGGELVFEMSEAPSASSFSP